MEVFVKSKAKQRSLEQKKSFKLALNKLKMSGFKVWLKKKLQKKNYKKNHSSQVYALYLNQICLKTYNQFSFFSKS